MNKRLFFALVLVSVIFTLGMVRENDFSSNSSEKSIDDQMLQGLIFSPSSWDFADTSCGNYRDFSFELKNKEVLRVPVLFL